MRDRKTKSTTAKRFLFKSLLLFSCPYNEEGGTLLAEHRIRNRIIGHEIEDVKAYRIVHDIKVV
jgi:hypothetical protein